MIFFNGKTDFVSKVSKTSIVTTTLLAGCFFTSMTAQASANYYNCNNSSGCTLVESTTQKSDYTKTQYPVVMGHGLSGWSSAFNKIDYFYGIPQDLMKGGSQVFATKVSSFHNAEFRGEQLLQQVKTITALTGKNKVNLVGHSLGGIDIRYVAGVAPQYVASVTAVSSPEQGSRTADWMLDKVAGGTINDGLNQGNLNIQSKIIMALMNAFGVVNDVSSGVPLSDLQEQNAWQSANGLTSGWLKTFNRKFPAAMPKSYCAKPIDTKVNGIPYYSFMGTGNITNKLDFTDYGMSLTGRTFNGEANDGLVAVCSSYLGKVLRDNYKMNHLDSVNQMLGFTAAGEVNPISVYRAQINRLKVQDGL